MTEILDVTDETFETEVLKSELPVLVDFWAPWCGPCKMIAPLIDQIVEKFQGKLKVVKVDVDVATKAPMEYGIRGVPALVIFKDGLMIDTSVGAKSLSLIEKFIERNI